MRSADVQAEPGQQLHVMSKIFNCPYVTFWPSALKQHLCIEYGRGKKKRHEKLLFSSVGLFKIRVLHCLMALDRYYISPISDDQRCEMYYIFLLGMDSDGKGFVRSDCTDRAGKEAVRKGNDLFKQNTVLRPWWWKWLVPMHYLNVKHVEATFGCLGMRIRQKKKKKKMPWRARSPRERCTIETNNDRTASSTIG